MRYATSRTCSREIDFEVDNNNIVTSCEFIGGCMGNTQGVARLVVGRSVDDVIKTLEGINCGNRGTSCPDELAQALKAYKASHQAYFVTVQSQADLCSKVRSMLA